MTHNINWMGLARNRRVQLVLLALAFSLALMAFRGLNQGIEFSGGVRIPITLERDVDPQTMDSIVETVKLRINKFGLAQSVVRPVGRNEVLVEIPKASPEVIESIRKILKEQGRFEAIIDGETALSGNDILPGAVGGPNQERILDLGGGKGWELGFATTRTGGERFAKAALGKGNYPVYMFLDRPVGSFIIARKLTIFTNESTALLGGGKLEPAIKDALRRTGSDIPILYAEDFGNGSAAFPANLTRAIVEAGVEKDYPKIAQALARENITVKIVSTEIMKPDYTPVQSFGSANPMVVSRWEAIGLLSAPVLSPALADGRVAQLFQITGPAKGATDAEQKESALKEIKELKSVISGGKLPVSTTIGSSFTVAPSLGERFLAYSWIGLLVSIAAVSLLILVRYRRMSLVLPIIFLNSVEVVITTAIIGVFGTLDLSAMAGIIVLMGSGVGDQIVMTEEVLRKNKDEEKTEDEGREEYDLKDRIGKAFYIIFTSAGVLLAAMLPLILSGIVEIVGFGVSTIIGMLVGIAITRPAYGIFVQEVFGKKSN